MGVIIKYQLIFPDVGLTISNDFYSGDFTIDADITVTMARGAAGCSFEIKLYDLPLDRAKKLNEKLAERREGIPRTKVVVKLGYFDGSFETVMEGLYKEISSTIEGEQLITSIKGLETITHALERTAFQNNLPDNVSIAEAARTLLENAQISEIDNTLELQNVSGTLTDVVFRGEKVLQVLAEIAEYAQAELLVGDKKVRIGKPITDNSYPAPKFQRDVNLARFQPFTRDIPEEAGRNLLKPLTATKANGFEFTITGDPKLRPAHKVLADVEDYDELAGTDFRIHSLVHSFTIAGGYVCRGVAIKICQDDNCRRREKAATKPSAESIAQSLGQKIQSEQRQRPTVEIAKVKEYRAGNHLSTLYFGQRFERTETQPSIRTEVETKESQIFRNRPIVSPFAWHKCGLVTPIYPGMKALLNHNINLTNDALVVGFIWSETPAIEAPKNQAGDWWLCLPIDFDSSNPPSDSTKAVSDLTANNGKRVIEVKGLKITIGNDRLRNIGIRPEEGGDDEFLIEHKSGTKIKIGSDGKLEIEATNISIKGNVEIEGNLAVK
jgi:hypothetical protein